MGEAKRRGTFEERKAAAIKREKEMIARQAAETAARRQKMICDFLADKIPPDELNQMDFKQKEEAFNQIRLKEINEASENKSKEEGARVHVIGSGRLPMAMLSLYAAMAHSHEYVNIRSHGQ